MPPRSVWFASSLSLSSASLRSARPMSKSNAVTINCLTTSDSQTPLSSAIAFSIFDWCSSSSRGVIAGTPLAQMPRTNSPSEPEASLGSSPSPRKDPSAPNFCQNRRRNSQKHGCSSPYRLTAHCVVGGVPARDHCAPRCEAGLLDGCRWFGSKQPAIWTSSQCVRFGPDEGMCPGRDRFRRVHSGTCVRFRGA